MRGEQARGPAAGGVRTGVRGTRQPSGSGVSTLRVRRAAIGAAHRAMGLPDPAASELGDGFSGHSPRVGMAQDLAADGAALPELMQAGRWRSSAMPALYVRAQSAGRGAVAKYYAGAAEPGQGTPDPAPQPRVADPEWPAGGAKRRLWGSESTPEARVDARTAQIGVQRGNGRIITEILQGRE